MLEENIPIWPTTAEQDLMLDKLAFIRQLDKIASDSNIPRPGTYTLAGAERLAKEYQTSSLVLKRNGSGCHRHIRLPPLSLPLINNIQDAKLGAIAAWFAQDYVPSLRTMGELRVFLFDEGSNPEIILATKFKDSPDEGEEDVMDMEVIKYPPPLNKDGVRWATDNFGDYLVFISITAKKSQ